MPVFGHHYVEGTSAWGGMTGKTLRFCEMDCYITPWIVEFVNTTTNLGYMLLGLYGYRRTQKTTRDPAILACHLTHILVGFGSTAYHMNVKYISQMADEIAMFILTNTILYTTLSISTSKSTQPERSDKLKTSIFAFTAVISAVHYRLGRKEPFEAVFISLVAIIVARCTYLVRNCVTDVTVKRELMSLLLASGLVALFAFAILIQRLDFVFCAQLTAFRAKIGWPLGFLTELHGWWHLITAASVYICIIFVEYLRAHLKEQTSMSGTSDGSVQKSAETSVKLIWKSRTSLPGLSIVGGSKVNGTNGSVKKQN